MAKLADPDATGPELVDETAKQPTLGKWFDRNPKHLTDAEYLELIEYERQNRALYNDKKGK